MAATGGGGVMEFVQYTPAHYDRLLDKRADPLFPAALAHRPFVDWYYGASPHLTMGCAVPFWMSDREMTKALLREESSRHCPHLPDLLTFHALLNQGIVHHPPG